MYVCIMEYYAAEKNTVPLQKYLQDIWLCEKKKDKYSTGNKCAKFGVSGRRKD